MKRDWRLLAAIVLLLIAAWLFKLEAEHIGYFSKGLWTGDWTEYGQRYGVDVSAAKAKYDYAPPQPIWQLFGSIGSFLAAIVLILWTWWKPKI